MLRRSSRRSRAEVNYAELAGEGGEDDNDAPQESVPEPEESPKRKSRKSKKTKNDEDEEYQGAAAEPSSERKRSAAGKPKKQKKKAKNEDDEEDDEDDGEGGPALVDLFAVGPSLRFVAGATEATIYHIPKDVVGLIFSHVPVDTLLAMRHGLKSRYFKKDIDGALGRMASAKFGVGADFRAWEVAALHGDRLRKGESKQVFRLRDVDLAPLPKKVVHRHGYYSYEEHWFNLTDLIPAAIKRHGSLEKLAAYQERLRIRKENIALRRGNSGAREESIQKELTEAGSLPPSVSEAVRNWIRLGTGPSEQQVKGWLEAGSKLRRACSKQFWEQFQHLVEDVCFGRLTVEAAVNQMEELEVRRASRQTEINALLADADAPTLSPSLSQALLHEMTVLMSNEAFIAKMVELRSELEKKKKRLVQSRDFARFLGVSDSPIYQTIFDTFTTTGYSYGFLSVMNQFLSVPSFLAHAANELLSETYNDRRGSFDFERAKERLSSAKNRMQELISSVPSMEVAERYKNLAGEALLGRITVSAALTQMVEREVRRTLRLKEMSNLFAAFEEPIEMKLHSSTLRDMTVEMSDDAFAAKMLELRSELEEKKARLAQAKEFARFLGNDSHAAVKEFADTRSPTGFRSALAAFLTFDAAPFPFLDNFLSLLGSDDQLQQRLLAVKNRMEELTSYVVSKHSFPTILPLRMSLSAFTTVENEFTCRWLNSEVDDIGSAWERFEKEIERRNMIIDGLIQRGLARNPELDLSHLRDGIALSKELFDPFILAEEGRLSNQSQGRRVCVCGAIYAKNCTNHLCGNCCRSQGTRSCQRHRVRK